MTSREAVADRAELFGLFPSEPTSWRLTSRLAVRVIGGQLPLWAPADSSCEQAIDAEFVIIRAPRIGATAESEPCLPVPDHPRFDFLELRPGDVNVLESAGARVLIEANASALDAAAEALAFIVVGGPLLIGVDLHDLYAAAGRAGGGGGRAVVVDGVGDEATGTVLRERVSELAEAGFDGAVLLVQLVRAQDVDQLDLARLDQMQEAAFEDRVEREPGLFTATASASRNAVVLIAFRSFVE